MTRGLATPVASTSPGTVRSPSSATRSGKRRRGRSRRHACRCYRRSRLWRALDARCVFPSAHKTWRGRLSPRHHLSVSRSPLSTSWWGSAAGWCMPIATKAMAARCMRHRRSGAKPGGSARGVPGGWTTANTACSRNRPGCKGFPICSLATNMFRQSGGYPRGDRRSCACGDQVWCDKPYSRDPWLRSASGEEQQPPMASCTASASNRQSCAEDDQRPAAIRPRRWVNPCTRS